LIYHKNEIYLLFHHVLGGRKCTTAMTISHSTYTLSNNNNNIAAKKGKEILIGGGNRIGSQKERK
jgi:hypothetical protein